MKHPRLLACAALLATLLGCATQPRPAAGPFVPGEWNAAPLVQTRYGLLEGAADADGTWSWKGIPYAAPPVGELRWKAPRPAQSWQGVRGATRFGSASAQLLPVLGLTGSEDCLYLNVWRPRSAERRLPVYVFVHGGGNSIGWSSLPDYHGHAVAARSNMVYVSLNYRLSVFGWFRSPALAEGEDALDAGGNYATLDIIAALRWIRENIAAFGGDPSRVTLSGESAGAFNVLSLLVSPKAEGLFHAAVVESGMAVMRSTETAEQAARTVTLRLLVRRGKAKDPRDAQAVLSGMSNAEIRAFLSSAPPGDLLRCVDKSPAGLAMLDWPTVYADGEVLPAEGYRALRDGSWVNKVPIVIGTTRDEAKLFLFFGRLYRQDRPLYESVASYRTALWRHAGVDHVADAITSHPGHPPVYAYRFDWGSPNARGESPLPGDLGRRLGAFHSVEIPFFLGTESNSVSFLTGPIFTAANRPGRAALTGAAMRYLAAFARTGNPNDTADVGGAGAASGAPLPAWEPWDRADGGFKALVMDVDGPALSFSVLRESPSLDSIEAGAPQATGVGGDLGLLKDFKE
jgi:para-nitrobenzyl esterase